MTHTPGLTFAVALAAGMLTHVVARKLQVPELVLLLAVGVLLGPEILGVIRPEALGTALDYVVGMSVAVILFEGGLNLNLDRLRREQVIVRRLVTLGALITAMGGTLAARWVMAGISESRCCSAPSWSSPVRPSSPPSSAASPCARTSAPSSRRSPGSAGGAR